jgi:hypothetical protein
VLRPKSVHTFFSRIVTMEISPISTSVLASFGEDERAAYESLLFSKITPEIVSKVDELFEDPSYFETVGRDLYYGRYLSGEYLAHKNRYLSRIRYTRRNFGVSAFILWRT